MAVNIAQAGANEVMGNWNGYQLGNIAIWSDTTIVDSLENGFWEVTIANRNNFVYFLTARGEVTDGGELWAGASRTIGIVTKMRFANIDPPAALTTRGKTVVKGGAVVNGFDTTPPTWAPYCSGVATSDTTGILTNDASIVDAVGTSVIDGTPPVEEDPTIVDETFTNFGDMDWAQLTALAAAEGKNVTSLGTSINNTGPDTTATGRCNETTLTNWGDTLPTAPCGSYFPLIYHGGNLTIQSGGSGQGVLLVEGNLDLRGDFLFYGIIIVQGSFETEGGTRVIGAVMASNSLTDAQGYTGSSEITYSRCAIQRSILNNASLSRARPIAERSWVDLTAVAN
jgi:hypothetical protein